MLKDRRVHTTLHATDTDRAKRLYAEVLGLLPIRELPFALIYDCADGTRFTMSLTSGEVPGTFTQMSFVVDDIAREVAELKARGLMFEAYDTGELKTVERVADLGVLKGAWFKDSEGNLIGLVELSEQHRLPNPT
jgi:catechol 2,3-dioxygenase-like lactoylglutathione lyase family enzyme